MRQILGRVVAAASAVVFLTGCCQKKILDITHLPPPITLEEQVARLDARTHALTHIYAKTVPLGVTLQYRDKKHEDHTEHVEGTLLLQPEPVSGGTGPQVLLSGRAFDRTVFQAGRNDQNWWFSLYIDPKTAFVGDSQRPIDWEALGNHNKKGEGLNTGVLRADLVPDLLGVRTLSVGGWGSSGASTSRDALAFRVDDYTVQNVILVEEVSPTFGQIWIKREIYIETAATPATSTKSASTDPPAP